MFYNAIQSILTLTILMAIGYYLAGRKWFGGGPAIFSKYCADISIPAYMVYNIITVCPTRADLWKLFCSLPIPLCTIIVGFLFALLLAKLARVEPGRRGVFLCSVTFSNTVLVGFPIIQALFGEEATPYGMIYYVANTFLFWTVGVYFLRRDGGGTGKFFSAQNMKKILSPAIVGVLIGAALVFFGITLPEFIFSALTKVQQTTTPLAMMFIGCIIHDTDFRSGTYNKDLLIIVAVRFVVSPLFMAIVCSFLPIERMMKLVFFVIATMPAMTQIGIMARESGSDYHYASAAVGLTTVLSVFTIPFYMWLVEALNLFV